MSAKLRLLIDICESLSEIIYDERNKAEKMRIEELDALEKAEAERKMRKRMEAAVILQKHWRGYIGRKYYKDCLLKHFRQISLKHYNSMATMVQKVWRGSWIRQHVYNYHKRKEYFQALFEKNDNILRRIQEFREERQRIQFQEARNIQKNHQIKLVCKYHHLVSTQNIPGIYNSPFRTGYSRDIFLKSAKFMNSSIKKRKRLNDRSENIADSIKKLPDVPPKCQGPFQNPQEVQLQRYKLPRMTLRMETDFYHLEKARKEMKNKEWTQRLHDNPFMPVIKPDSSYPANMQTMSVYIPLGEVKYRKEDPSLNVDTKDFKLVLTPVSLFDEFQEKMEELKNGELIKLT